MLLPFYWLYLSDAELTYLVSAASRCGKWHHSAELQSTGTTKYILQSINKR